MAVSEVVNDLHYIFEYLRDADNAAGLLGDMVEQSGLSKRAVAARSGVSPSAVCKMCVADGTAPKLDNYAAAITVVTESIIENAKE